MDGLLTDEDLSAAVSGDGRSAEKIYRSLSPKVMGYLQARGVEDTEAVAQEVFLTVFQKLDKVTGGVAGLKTFTFSVAHARVVDAARARARHPHLAEYDPDFDTRTVASAEQVVVDRSGGDVVQLLQTLNPDQREVLSLRIVADLPIDQVASVMGKSEGSVKQLQRRALAKLKDMVIGSKVGGAS